MRLDLGKTGGEWLKIAEVVIFLCLVPIAIFDTLGTRWPLVLTVSYHFIVSMLVFQAALSYLYTIAVFRKKDFIARACAHHDRIPKTTFIVVAYLPNELAVIEQTLSNILQNVTRPKDGIEVVFVYNTPHFEALELRLRDLACRYPELILANAHGSRGKSENLNYAIDMASGEMVVILDADHVVAGDCLARAWRWLDEGYDVVQGLCKVRNNGSSLVTRAVDVEFEMIYGIQHASKSLVYDSTLFGGSNGYWRASVIKEIRFGENMLTEDIDSTVRGTLAGYHFVHDRSIVSTELAPVSLGALWFQRKRWAQGWFQCSLKYQLPLWKTSRLNPFQKFLWTTLLSYRVFYDVISVLLFPVLAAYWMGAGKVFLPMDGYIWFALIFTFLSGPFQALAAYMVASSPRASGWWYVVYAFLVWPYTLFKSMVNLVAVRDELSGERSWIVSKRVVR